MRDQQITRVEGVAVEPSPRFFRRQQAADYLTKTYGFGAVRTLAKGVVTGDGPEYHKCGRIVLYQRDALDKWAQAKISKPIRSSSEMEGRR
jgi:hypothetical protein